ncbi:MAG TPA: uroporphyrinogen-III C-methyltransferase [Acidobacteriaceae bacterium]|jgi:uroporphyrin-III C-methyltransferase|nr:uroporphyrinogen-III C-methyltransferase [Acidobacteriaceae bacterium]
MTRPATDPLRSTPNPRVRPAASGASSPVPGKVWLVGAGPGDPDLLTVRATGLLAAADVVLHDDLVPPAILNLARAQALVINVGKRCGRKSITQEQIHSMLIDLARRGLSVVRLQSGDPLLFGRAGEEIRALTAAGIPFDIVPGITAAFAAAAALHMSLTDRRTASTVVLSAGHHADSSPEARPHTPTRVVYMPGRDLAPIAARLRAEGLAAVTPCVIVSRAGQPEQQIQRTTLADLPALVPGPAPAILLAGEVFRESPSQSALTHQAASLSSARPTAYPAIL